MLTSTLHSTNITAERSFRSWTRTTFVAAPAGHRRLKRTESRTVIGYQNWTPVSRRFAQICQTRFPFKGTNSLHTPRFGSTGKLRSNLDRVYIATPKSSKTRTRPSCRTSCSNSITPLMASLSVEEALSTASGSVEVAASLLWNLDGNRLRPGTDYKLDVQDRSHGYSDDAASQPLIVHLADDVWNRPTFGTFKKLLDNYTAETGIPERVSQEERNEEDHFLAAICKTPCIRFVHQWLAANTDVNAGSIDEFSDFLKRIWFYQYSRDASRDSSGFEHVFIGELDDGKVKGLHNFIQVFVEEVRGNFNYKGYLDIRGEPSREAPPPNQQMITIRFDWLGKTKSVSSMFIGASPEFEIALYTLLFVAQAEELELDLGPYRTRIKVYQMAGKIGTAFPELLGVDHDKLQENAPPISDHHQTSAPPPTTASFPPLGSVPAPAKQAVSSYAAALLRGGDEQGDEVEGGDDAEGADAGNEGGEGQTKNIFKWFKIFVSIAKKMKSTK